MMMIKRILGALRSRKCLGISIHAEEDTCVGALVSQDADEEIHLIKTFNSTTELKGFIGECPTMPIMLSVYSSSIIHTESNQEISSENVEKVFSDEYPTADIDDFVVGYYGRSFAVIRKNELERLLEELSVYEGQIVKVFLGVLNELPLVEVVSAREESKVVRMGQFEFGLGESPISYQVMDPWDLDLGDIRVPGIFVAPFCSVLNHLNQWGAIHQGAVFIERSRELWYQRIFRSAKIPILGVFLLLFLINTVAYFYLNGRNQELHEQSMVMESLKKRHTQLSQFVNENEQILNQLQSVPKYAIICDQVGKSLPRSIALSTFAINPIAENNRKKKVEDSRRVVIEGTAQEPVTYTHWVSVLKQMDWVAEVKQQTLNGEAQKKDAGWFQLILERDVE